MNRLNMKSQYFFDMSYSTLYFDIRPKCKKEKNQYNFKAFNKYILEVLSIKI